MSDPSQLYMAAGRGREGKREQEGDGLGNAQKPKVYYSSDSKSFQNVEKSKKKPKAF